MERDWRRIIYKFRGARIRFLINMGILKRLMGIKEGCGKHGVSNYGMFGEIHYNCGEESSDIYGTPCVRYCEECSQKN